MTAPFQDGIAPIAQRNPSKSSILCNVAKLDCDFDLHLLQEDMVTTYLAGKPLLKSAASIRIPFKFKNVNQQKPSTHPAEYDIWQ